MSLFYMITSSVIAILIGIIVFSLLYLGKILKEVDRSAETSKDSTTEVKEPYLLFDFENKDRPGFFRRMELNWKFEWKYIPRNIKIGFENLYLWFSIIWNDRHWDGSYLLKLMKFKIEKMADYHESRQFYVGWENNVKWMRTTCKLIDKVSDEYYQTEWFEYFDTDMWCVPEEGDGDFVSLDFEIKWESVEDYLNKYPLQIDEVKEMYKEVKGKEIDFEDLEEVKYFSMLLSHHNHERAKRLLFKIMAEKIDHWWD